MAMAAKANRKGRTSDTAEHFTKYLRETTESAAWLALKPTARLIYLQMKFEWKGPRNNNNGRIRFSARQAATLVGCNKNTASEAMRDLQRKGFLRITQMGCLGFEGEAKNPMYEITEIALPGETKASGAYLRWKKGHDFDAQLHPVNNPHGARSKGNPVSNFGM